jgi:hypothetical protein
LASVECWVSGSRRGELHGSYGGVGGEASTALLADGRHGVLSPVWLQVGRPARSVVVVAESRGAGEWSEAGDTGGEGRGREDHRGRSCRPGNPPFQSPKLIEAIQGFVFLRWRGVRCIEES